MSDFKFAQAQMAEVDAEINKSVVISDVDRHALVSSLFLEAPILFEGTPGLGKTTIAKAAATAIGGTFGRIQGGPDLRPTDITGGLVWNRKSDDLEFHEGPMFVNVLLADEINRTAPKSLSAMLEAMQEKQVTVDRNTYNLPRPFIVMATQNPDEDAQGTFPVPWAAIDRFQIGIKHEGYTGEARKAVRHKAKVEGYVPQQVIDIETIPKVKKIIEGVGVSDQVENQAIDRLDRLAQHEMLGYSGQLLNSGRALIQLVELAQAKAAMEGGGSIGLEHVNFAAGYVLPHRMEVRHEVALDEGLTSHDVVQEIFS